jgi:hypothetical protein
MNNKPTVPMGNALQNQMRNLKQTPSELSQVAKNAQTKRVNDAQTMQASFFTLRAQLFNTFLSRWWMWIALAHWLAHRAARKDLMRRVEDANALLANIGEEMVFPDVYMQLARELNSHERARKDLNSKFGKNANG